ncbi:GNAT family N-acetyltransferase [soil metagenome]
MIQAEVIQADYFDLRHGEALILLLDAYARDPMGGGVPLSEHAKENLLGELQRRPTAFSVLAFVDARPAGLINCFEGFSTFVCRPLINIHDLVVLPAFRGQGVGQQMLRKVEQIALERGCCKLTLEVLQGNLAAQNLYLKSGFAGYQLAVENGNALFWQKNLGR